MIDGKSEVVKIPKLVGGKSHSRYPNPHSQYPPPPSGMEVGGFDLEESWRSGGIGRRALGCGREWVTGDPGGSTWVLF